MKAEFRRLETGWYTLSSSLLLCYVLNTLSLVLERRSHLYGLGSIIMIIKINPQVGSH